MITRPITSKRIIASILGRSGRWDSVTSGTLSIGFPRCPLLEFHYRPRQDVSCEVLEVLTVRVSRQPKYKIEFIYLSVFS